MGFTALEETEEGHDQVHPVARRSILSTKCSSRLRFSGFSSFPAGARMFSLVMLALTLTWPCDFGVGAVNFTFNGFKENDVYLVSDSSWILDSNTSCIYFDPPNASRSISVAGRFLNPGLVQMRDPVSKKVKSFSARFIYQIRIPPGNSSAGPGMAFIIVPDNVTVGAPGDYMGLLIATPKNFESDDHTLGVELDTHMNLEFNDPGKNHIGINLASMNSTYTCKPDYNLASKSKDTYQQVWIDYFEADSRMDVFYAYYGQSKPDRPQGFQRGLDLSFINENMYIGFSSAKGKESDNVPYVCAWSFSNDGPLAPPILIGRDVLPASPPSSPRLQPPAPAPVPPPSLTKGMKTLIGSLVSLFIVVFVFVSFFCWWKIFRRPVRIFISHAAAAGCRGESQKNFIRHLYQRISKKRWLKLRVCDHTVYGRTLLSLFLVSKFDVGIVVVSREIFESTKIMSELIALAEASKKELGKSVRMLPLFYKLTPNQISHDLASGYWEALWKEMTEFCPLQMSEIEDAVKWLTTQPGIIYDSSTHSDDKEYIEDVIKAVYKIFYEERWYSLFPSCLGGAMTATAIWGIKRLLAAVGKRLNRARAPLRAEKEIGVMTYVQKLLHLLFALSGLLIIFSSIILDNSFNHQPQRFIAFAILAPVMIFLGILASGCFPRIPLWLIACSKRRGFLKHVSACSPWHDNVVTDFCGDICTLEPLEEAEGIESLELHQPLLRFIHGISLEGSTFNLAPDSRDFQGAASTLEPEGECLHQLSALEPLNEDSSSCSSQDYKDAGMSEMIEIPPTTMVPGQALLPKFQEALFPGEDIVVSTDHSSKFHVLDKARGPTLTIEGPMINLCGLKVQVWKDTLSRDPTFDLTCTFRNKMTTKKFLTTQRLQNLAQNMYRWVDNPHPIVINESSDVLHCLAIQDILSKFTKGVFSFKPFHVQHRYLAGLWTVSPWIVFSYVAVWSFLSLFPLLSDKKSYFFLISLVVLVPYLFTSKDTNPLNFYNFRELFCPIFIYVRGFSRLYLSRSLFIWCNEFKKQRVVNPEIFWIDEEYSNNFLDREGCFDVYGFVDIPATPIIQSFLMKCRGRVNPHDPTNRLQQHNYKLKVGFDNAIKDTYTNVVLSFYENNDLLDRKHYSLVDIRRLYLIEQLFYSYSDSFFGGYVERICPGFWSRTYLAHSPRFLDICHKIISADSDPTFVRARRACSSKFIIGVPFWFSNPEVQ